MDQKQTARGSKWRLMIPIVVAFGFTAALAVNTLRMRQGAVKETVRELGAAAVDLQSLSLAKVSSALLIDSILSIVQTYYVDPNRVSHDALLDVTVKSVRTNLPGFKIGRDEDGKRWVEFESVKKTLLDGENLSYEQLVDRMAALSDLISEGFKKQGALPGKNSDPDLRNGTAFVLNSLLVALDAHSALLSSESYRELRQGTEGAFGGLGVLVGIRDSLLTVIKPLPRSPALRAGIKRHDKILSIDGTETFGSTLDHLVEFMRGDPGTSVNISLLREGAVAPVALSLKREVIHVDSATVMEHKNQGLNVLHLQVESFATRTSREVLSAIKKAKRRGRGQLDGLILDLRSNPGGLLDQAVQVSDLFLQSGVIVSTRGRREEVEKAGPGYDEVDFPIVVLINEDSASASEIVAGALQDHGRAVVVGQPSFGKGSVQTIFELPEERALKLTIARYYTPGNRSIQNIGIIPDVWSQPLMRQDKNANLLGSSRYRNERFLRNHLSGNEDESGEILSVPKPAIKSYYLSENREDPAEEDAPQVDHEYDLAMTIIKKVRAVYSNSIPESARRSSHWLALAGPEIHGLLDHLDEETSAWLSKRHGVDWTSSPPAVNLTSEPPLELKVGSIPSRAFAGDDVSIPWTIRNLGEQPVAHLSVFIRSLSQGFATKEVLIGKIGKGEVRTGALNMQIPMGWEAGPLSLTVGLAIDAWPNRNAASEVTLIVDQRPAAELSADIKFVDGKGSRQFGALEAGETGTLEIVLRNVSETDAHKVEVRLQSLSGRQLVLDSKPLHFGDLMKGQSRVLNVPIGGTERLISESLFIGLAVVSRDQAATLFQRTSVKGVAAKNAQRDSGIVAH